MSEVTEIRVDAVMGGTIQIIKFKYSEQYQVGEGRTYSGQWTPEEADAFYDERYAEIYERVAVKAQSEVDRLTAMRDQFAEEGY